MIAETRIVGNKPRWVALWVCLLMLFAAWGSAWAECVPAYLSEGTNVEFFCAYGSNCSRDEQNCMGEGSCETPCPETYTLYGEVYSAVTLGNQSRCIWIGYGNEVCGKYWGAGKYTNCVYTVKCSNQCEADSVNCVNKGQQWDSQNCECKQCTQKDSSWTELTQCTYNPLSGMYYVEKTTYTLKDCQLSSSSMRYTAPQCEDRDSTYRCLGTINGSQVMMQAPSGATFNCDADGSCDAAMRQIASGQCKPPPPNSSSGGGGGSSSSAESSSSGESSSSDGDGSSSSGGGSSDSGDGSNDWEGWMKDSLGAIHGTLYNVEFFVTKTYDGVMELNGTAHDINQNTRDIANTGLEISDKMDDANEYLRQIAGKNFNPTINVGSPDVNVNVDTDGIQARQDKTRDTLHHTNEILDGLGGKLEDIKGLLGSSGSDTIRIDTSKAPASIDSALKYWGNRNNRTFAAAGLDTSGWGSMNDSAGAATDSVLSRADFFGSLGCDTTDGKKCDGSIIGADGLATATGEMQATYGELRDSLTGGAYADSLRLWGGKFTGNGVLTGSGSNSCPSVISRTYRVDLIEGVGYDFTLGTYLCAPIFGQVTAWSLCRMLLRATVALACMWFLFKCATGFGGGSED